MPGTNNFFGNLAHYYPETVGEQQYPNMNRIQAVIHTQLGTTFTVFLGERDRDYLVAVVHDFVTEDRGYSDEAVDESYKGLLEYDLEELVKMYFEAQASTKGIIEVVVAENKKYMIFGHQIVYVSSTHMENKKSGKEENNHV